MLYYTLISKKNNQFVLGYDNAKGFVVSRQVSPYQFQSKEEYISALKSIQQDVVNFEVKTYCLIEAGKRPTERELKAFLQGVFWDDVFEQLAYMYPLELDDTTREKYKSFATLVLEKGEYNKNTVKHLIEDAVVNGMGDTIKALD